MDPLQVQNPLTDQNQTQHNSLCSGELLKDQNSFSVDQRGPTHKGSTYKLSVGFFNSFFILFVSWISALPKRLGRFWRSIRQTTRSHARRCLLWVLTLAKTSNGVILTFSPKTPKTGPGIGISSLNKCMDNFSTVRAILAQVSSIGAA